MRRMIGWRLISLGSIALCAFAFSSARGEGNSEPPAHGASAIEILRDETYGSAIVGASGDRQERPMMLDVYLPSTPAAYGKGRQAIILAFGGAFHRGNKGDLQYAEDGARDSSMADYCTTLAQRGLVCFSIDYRVVPDDPPFPVGWSTNGAMSKELLHNPLMTGRIETVRARMGIPPLDDQSRDQLWNATFAAVEDFENALNFVKANANKYGVDPERVAVGGFSAGAITAINLAYGRGADVCATVSISGASWGYDLKKTVRKKSPALLQFAGQWDLPAIQYGNAGIAKLLSSRGVSVVQAWVPGFGHFYPKEAPSLAVDFDKTSVIDRIVDFLTTGKACSGR